MKMTAEPQANPPEASASDGAAGQGGYKPDQGRHARMAAFWAVVLLVLFGCRFLHAILVGNFATTREVYGQIPIVGIALTPAFLVSAVVFGFGVLQTLRWQKRPRMADLLIDTESELRKVTWPSIQEIVSSSIVVGISVVLIGAYLAFSDWFLTRVMEYLIFGQVGK